MVIQNNLAALSANNVLTEKTKSFKKSSEKLSSGYRINRSADDAAGLAVSEKMRSKIRGIKQSIRNSQDGVSLVQTFEGALGETVSIIHRMKELTVESANGNYSNEVDRKAIQLEFGQLRDEIDQLADTDYNGVMMLNGGEMADGFTFFTNDGVMWLTPSDAEFPEDGFISTFQEVEGFPEIEMSIELLPEAKKQLVSDKELMQALEVLNSVSVRSFYNQGIPEFSLVDLDEEWSDKISIQTNGSEAIISVSTSQSGTIDVAKVSSTELPHYASTSATGKWIYQSVASGSIITTPDASAPGNDQFDLSKWTESYANSSSATRAERQAYIDWIKATSARAELVMDDNYDKDTDPLKFTWSIDGSEYENYDSDSSGLGLPLYKDTSKGPQIYIKNLHYYYDDENMKLSGSSKPYYSVSYTTYSRWASGTYDGKKWECKVSLTSNRMKDIWLDNGSTSVTLIYNKAENKWYDNFGGSGSASDYGIDFSPNSYNSSDYKYNLNHFYEDDGKLPDGFVISTSTSCGYGRTTSSGGYVWNKNSAHSDNSNGTANYKDFKLEELDPAYPERGGVDYTIAKHNATYTYDGIQAEWLNAEGDVVNLEDEGIYLPTTLNSNIQPLHDGMKITVSNPTMVGEDYIQAKIRLFDEDRSMNAYRKIYDNLTYTEDLVLQVGSRTKDGVEFTFNYNNSSMGELIPDLNVSSKGLGLDELSVLTQESANDAIDKLELALSKTSMVRSCFGSIQNRLEHKIDNLTNDAENATASESQIRDTDMALEMMNFTKDNILSQTAQAMLSQSIKQPESVLQLLG